MKIAIIGGGAAGFFSAISVKENYPDAAVVIFEKSNHVLSKVKISGGGRCNVTHACKSVDELCEAYPRGGRKLKKIFHIFSNNDTMKWFGTRGVALTVQDDCCVFPVSQNSQSIINCFIKESERLGIRIMKGCGVESVKPFENDLELCFENPKIIPEKFDKVIVTTGGSPKRDGLKWLEDLGHKIEDPVPSLFTFNMPEEPVTSLMGVVADHVIINIRGTRLRSSGPLLITHWGMSGPAVINLSSYAARLLNEMNYNCKVQVNWVHEANSEIVGEEIKKIAAANSAKMVANYRPYSLPARLWVFLLEKCGLPGDITWGTLSNKGFNKLINVLTNDEYSVNGRTKFRDEFVTCGGVSLESVDMNTMQSKACGNLYFAGEVLDIDAITGGYNFQCAWTTAYIAGKLQ